MGEAIVITSENLAEYNAKALDLAPDTEIVVEAKEAPKEEVKTDEKIKDEEKKDEHKVGKLEKRFSKLTTERREAEERAQKAEEELRARDAEVEALKNPKPKELDAEGPKRDQFQNDDEYVDARAEWKYKKLEAQRTAERQAQEQRTQAEKRHKTWLQRQAEFAKENPDYEETIAQVGDEVQVHQVVLDALVESEIGPKILYHLTQNPDIVETWKDLSPAAALRALGKLEAKLETPKEEKADVKVEKSKAEAPIVPIKGKTVPDAMIDSKGEFKGTYQQFKEMVESGKIK